MAEQSPIIDMHLHAVPEGQGRSLDEMLHDMDTHGIARAVLIVRDTVIGMQWSVRAPERFLLSPALPCYEGRSAQGDPCFESKAGWPDFEWLKRQYESGRMEAMGEILYVYYGIPPTDARLEPYWALAAEMDIPVGVHIGRRPRQTLPTGCCPNYDDNYGDPALLEPVLQRHPGLRIWLMHAGGRNFLHETIRLMKGHANVYADMSIVNSVSPQAVHMAGLQAFRDAGVLDRIMFGSDNEPFGPIIQRIEAVPFLTEEERRAIYCDNAARFLRLHAGTCAFP